ncbi:MAG TPA: hypothetical protein VGK02_05910 [Candidatus Aquicultor sp.]
MSAIIVDPREEFFLDVIDFYHQGVEAEKQFEITEEQGSSAGPQVLEIYRYARAAIILMACSIESHVNVLLRIVKGYDLTQKPYKRMSIFDKLKELGFNEKDPLFNSFEELNDARNNIVHEKGEMDYSKYNPVK